MRGRSHHPGKPGSGQVAKLLDNLLFATNLVNAANVLALASEQGKSRRDAVLAMGAEILIDPAELSCGPSTEEQDHGRLRRDHAIGPQHGPHVDSGSAEATGQLWTEDGTVGRRQPATGRNHALNIRWDRAVGGILANQPNAAMQSCGGMLP